MKPKSRGPEQDDLLRPRLTDVIDMCHEPVKLGALRRDLRRRSAIEPIIGHMKTDSRFARCVLKGTIRVALHAVPCACGHNIGMILADLRALWAQSLVTLLSAIGVKASNKRSDCGLKGLAA